MDEKPMGGKAYGSIPHLPGSRIGPGDYHAQAGQALICTTKARDRHDIIIVQEKLDGSCVAAWRQGDEIIALVRRGYLARTSPFEMHHLFADWVEQNKARFRAVLTDGERLCGEWLAQAHTTRYKLPHEPLVVFDLMQGHERVTYDELVTRTTPVQFITPGLIHRGEPVSIEKVLTLLEPSRHGAIDPVEGAVWRVERQGRVDFLAKYVRPDKVDGLYLRGITSSEDVWNWHPGDSQVS